MDKNKYEPYFLETCKITFNGTITTVSTGESGSVNGENIQITAKTSHVTSKVDFYGTKNGAHATFPYLDEESGPIDLATLKVGLGMAGFDHESFEEIINGALEVQHLR